MPADVSRRVVVKFRDAVVIPYEDGAERHIEELHPGSWGTLAARFRGIRLNRLFTNVAPERLGELVAQAMARDPTYRAPNFLSFFVIECPPDVDPEALAAVLREWPHVETAYVDPLDDVPGPVDNPRYPNQTYLKPPAVAAPPAPQGAIDAEFAWLQPGGTGTGQRIVDLERGATLDHVDLNRPIAQLHGMIDPAFRFHGARTLGVLAAIDNTEGNIGIAYGLCDVAYTSQVVNVATNVVDRVAAVTAAINHFTQGGQDPTGRVLLLEVQLNPLLGGGGVVWNRMPMETVYADYAIIQMATQLGIIVIEAAGNGKNDLDTYRDASTNKFVLSRTHPGDLRDSGAIMVGGSTANYPYQRHVFDAAQGTSWGSRVDCFAWAESVDTCDSNAAGSTNLYTGSFAGTSSASAIVAGAALLVQGVAQAVRGSRLTPAEMRAVLSDPAFNTKSANYGVDLIGVMPNLRRILQERLELAPDVYVRDFVGDTGAEHAGTLSMSPDIIVRGAALANAAVTLGPGTENDMALGETVTRGTDNYVYVRVFNRSAVPATNVKATVYYAEPTTMLLNPAQWTLVGSVDIPVVPGNDVMTVSPPIVWSSAQLPAAGHYCFMAIVGNAQDPPRDPATFATFDEFESYVRTNNNVTWRNFNVVTLVATFTPRELPFEFFAAGAWDHDRRFGFAVAADLPAGARLWLEVPAPVVRTIAPTPVMRVDGETAWLRLNPHGRTAFAPAVIRAGLRVRCRLIVEAPRIVAGQRFTLSVSQLRGEYEVGRVTWQARA